MMMVAYSVAGKTVYSGSLIRSLLSLGARGCVVRGHSVRGHRAKAASPCEDANNTSVLQRSLIRSVTAAPTLPRAICKRHCNPDSVKAFGETHMSVLDQRSVGKKHVVSKQGGRKHRGVEDDHERATM